jgi:hypothetical protein
LKKGRVVYVYPEADLTDDAILRAIRRVKKIKQEQKNKEKKKARKDGTKQG